MSQTIEELLEVEYTAIDKLDKERRLGMVGFNSAALFAGGNAGTGWTDDQFAANDAQRADIMKRIENLKAGRVPSNTQLDDAVPIPPKAAQVSYPIADMRIGQSFAVAGDKAITNAHSAFSRYKKAHPGFNYTSASEGDVSRRFWRTA